MFRPNKQGELTELSLKQRQQMFSYRQPTLLYAYHRLRIEIPRRGDTPHPSPEIGYLANPKAKI